MPKYQSPAEKEIRRDGLVGWALRLTCIAMGMAIMLMLLHAFNAPEACAWGCAGHICVEDFDCPQDCSCARIPWEPAGECV